MKYYFLNKDSEMCYTKDHFIDLMKDNDLTEIEVYPAKMVKGESYSWCTELQDAIETGRGDCGRSCDDYKPRNGKNGRCRFSKNCYEPDEKPIILKLK